MSLSRKQSSVLTGMIAAVFVSGLTLAAGAFLFPQGWLGDETTGGRSGIAAKSILAIGFWLLVSIGALARHRFFTPEDIDGSGLTSGTATARRLQAVLQNTLEQTALAVISYGCFAALAPFHLLGALPAAALLFWVGRALFWHGYAKGAGGRAFGFALTFYSTAMILAASLIMTLA